MATKLHGHKNTVLSLATTHHDCPKILSGTESGEIGLWSVDGGGVQLNSSLGETDVTSLCCSKLQPDIFYAAVGDEIHCYDIRKFNTAFNSFNFNEEEINQICINEKETFLAACDDSGQVKVISLPEKRVYKTLRKHTNICATVAFRSDRPWDLYSGGYDNKLIQWDFSRPRAVCTIDMTDVGLADQGDGPYLLNPPFVHSLAVSTNGRHIACGTESGLVQLFRTSKKNLEHVQALREHCQGVSQVYFPKFAENILVSGGNDGKINIWDLSLLSSKAAPCNGLSTSGAAGNAAVDDPQQAQSSNQTATSDNPLIRATIDHGEKINWLTSGFRSGQKFIVVADSSVDLTLHSFPQ